MSSKFLPALLLLFIETSINGAIRPDFVPAQFDLSAGFVAELVEGPLELPEITPACERNQTRTSALNWSRARNPRPVSERSHHRN